MKFRSDIQALRGISVLLVVFFHLNVSYFSNGYIGVDIFFVISGFLMAQLYNNSTAIEFYKRRAKRLLPAYYATVLATLIACFLFTSPYEFSQTINQGYFSLFYISNFGFWLQNSYFSKEYFNPLLHLWSIAVEIQFYALLPLIVILFRKIKFFNIFICVTSFIACCYVMSISPKTAFFLTPFRIWELLLGFIAGDLLRSRPKTSNEFKQLLVVPLFVVVLIFILLTPLEPDSGQFTVGHPGLSALSVSMATALLLFAGAPAFLENWGIYKLLVTIGKYSYSIYLSHFPIIVIYLSEPFSGTILSTNSIYEFILIVVQISFFSVLLHHTCERNLKYSAIQRVAVLGSLLIGILCFTLPAIQKQHLTTREKNIYNSQNDRSHYRCGKIHRVLNPVTQTCLITKTPENFTTSFLLLGDSHADSIKTTFAKVADDFGYSAQFMVGNNPLNESQSSIDNLLQLLKSNNIDHVFVHFAHNSPAHYQLPELINLAEKSQINITYLDPVPTWPDSVPKLMLNSNHRDLLAQSREDYYESNKHINGILGTVKSESFKRIHTAQIYCETDCIYQSPEGKPLYFDSNHLTITGADILSDTLHDYFEKITAGK